MWGLPPLAHEHRERHVHRVELVLQCTPLALLADAYEQAGASCLVVDGVDDELWGRFFTLAEGDDGAKLKSLLKVVDADDNAGPLVRR